MIFLWKVSRQELKFASFLISCFLPNIYLRLYHPVLRSEASSSQKWEVIINNPLHHAAACRHIEQFIIYMYIIYIYIIYMCQVCSEDPVLANCTTETDPPRIRQAKSLSELDFILYRYTAKHLSALQGFIDPLPGVMKVPGSRYFSWGNVGI